MRNYHFPFLILTIPLISLCLALSLDVVGDAIAGQVDQDIYVCMSVEKRTVVGFISACVLLVVVGKRLLQW